MTISRFWSSLCTPRIEVRTRKQSVWMFTTFARYPHFFFLLCLLCVVLLLKQFYCLNLIHVSSFSVSCRPHEMTILAQKCDFFFLFLFLKLFIFYFIFINSCIFSFCSVQATRDLGPTSKKSDSELMKGTKKSITLEGKGV